MPDLGPAVGGLLNLLTPILGPALGAFLRTTAGMLALAVGMTGLSFWWAAQGSTLRGVLAALLAFAVCGGIGLTLAGKRAIGRGLLHGLRKLGLGAAVLHQVFGRLLGVSDREQMGQRGSALAKTLESLPLAQAEQRLCGTIDSLLAERAKARGLRAWLSRKLQGRLLRAVRDVTLKRFRQAEAAGTGVDLVMVRDELAGKVDTVLAAKIESTLRMTTLALVAAAVLLSWAGAAIIRQIPV